jgi:hypothetical protein
MFPQPFERLFAGRRNHADRYSAEAAHPAYILASQ